VGDETLADAEKYMADLQMQLDSARKNFDYIQEKLLDTIWKTRERIVELRRKEKAL